MTASVKTQFICFVHAIIIMTFKRLVFPGPHDKYTASQSRAQTNENTVLIVRWPL